MLALAIGALVPCLMVGAGIWFGFQLLRQSGRILVRLEAVERGLASLVALAEAAREGPNTAQIGGSRPDRAPPEPPLGLTPGVPAPAFELPNLSGIHTSIAQFQGRRVLLVFFNPQCVFCVQMTPDLSALPLDDPNVALPVVVTTGDVAANRRLFEPHGVRCPVLLQRQMEVAAAYQANGTPTGYLIDEDGRVASPLAIGAEALLMLARRRGSDRTDSLLKGHEGTVRADDSSDGDSENGRARREKHHGNRTLADSRLIRDGLERGTPAPGFRLPRLNGGEIALSDYRGKRVLVVFSDPHCGPCRHAASALQARYSAASEVQLVMVSRGDRGDNLAKVSELGLTFPVVLQQQWEISRLYGMFATPIGYLIDERGVICRDVAVGVDAILALYGDPAIRQTQLHNLERQEVMPYR